MNTGFLYDKVPAVAAILRGKGKRCTVWPASELMAF